MATEIPQLASEPRTKLGSRYAIRLREKGHLPGVVYGHGEGAVHIAVDAKAFSELLHHSAHLIELHLDGNTQPCLIKDVQYDYLNTTPIHLDLTRVNLDEEVEVEVEIELTGEPIGLKVEGAVLDQQLNQLTVRCKANNIPELIRHNVKALEAGGNVHVSDLVLPDGVEAVDEDDIVVAMISIQEELPEETIEDELDQSAEPEVIGVKDDDEVEGDAGEDDAD